VNVDDLSGRELDALVAERLFGLEVEPRTDTRTDEMDAVCRTPGGEWVRVAFYGITLSASIGVEAELQHRGWKRKASTSRANWNEPVVLEHSDGRTVEASGPRYEALCRAALKAVLHTPT
jgi:hypothetical protein